MEVLNGAKWQGKQDLSSRIMYVDRIFERTRLKSRCMFEGMGETGGKCHVLWGRVDVAHMPHAGVCHRLSGGRHQTLTSAEALASHRGCGGPVLVSHRA